MASKTLEAKLLITAESRVEAEMVKVAKAIQQGLDVTKYTAEAAKLSKAWEQQAKAAKAAAAVMDARKPLEATVQGMQRVGAQATRLAREYDVAKKAAAEYGKAQTFIKGSEQAAQAARLAAEVRRLGDAHRAAVNDTKALTAAFSAETAALRAAESAASRYGVDLSRVEQQQRTLARSTDQAAAAFRRQVAAEDLAAKRAVVNQERSAARRGLVSAGAVVAGGKIDATAKAAEHTYAEFDMEIRRQVAMAGLTKEERSSRINQAVRLGGASTFNDIQVLHAQRTLAGRGVRKDLVEPFVEEILNYAQAMNVELPSAAKTLEGIVFSTNQHIEDAATATKVMRRNVDLAVKTAKVGGLEDHDIQAAFKMGGATSTGAGFSIETMDTIFALLRKSGYSGEEAGTAARGISSKFIAPSKQGLTALDAMGVKYQNFVRMPDALNADRLGSSVKRTFGKDISPRQMQRLQALMNDPDALLDRDKFTASATGIIGQSFDKNKKGQLKAADAHAIAKTVGDFYKMAAESVDTEGLLRAVINAHPTQAQLNALVTREHGGKLGSIAQKPELFDEYRKKIADTPEGFAKSIGDAVMGGFYGAQKRIENTRLNVETAMGRSLDNNGEGGGLLTRAATAIADFQQHIAELDPKIVALGTSVTVAGGKIAEAAGTLGLMGSALALTKSAASLELAAAKLAAAKLAVNGGGLPDAAKKGGRLAGLAKGALGITAIGGLAELAQHYDTLKMPEFTKDGIGRGLLGALDPNLPDMVLGKKADEIGKDAGTKVGKGVAEGVKEKAPEVEAEGKTLFQRLNEQFRQGIFVPIHFMPGEGMGGGAGGGAGLIQKASFGGGGGADLSGMVRKASIGSGGGLGGGTGSVVRRGGGGSVRTYEAPTGPYLGTGSTAGSLTRLSEEAARAAGIDPRYLHGIRAGESGHRGNYDVKSDRVEDSYGPFQLNRRGGLGAIFEKETGLSVKDPRTIADQARWVARHIAKKLRANPNYNPGTEWFGYKGRREADPKWGNSGYRPTLDATARKTPDEPRLVRGLDGVEGLDLGDGTMRMPNGAIRSIQRGMPEIPEAPAGGIGAAGNGRGGIGAHVEEFGRHVDRLADMGFHGQIEVTGLHRAGMRATGLKVRGRGGMTADMGITLPDLERDGYSPPSQRLTDV
ncbi:phage tail tape measure protein [Methylobacterium oryzae]|uniref:TP901 family phage tail tape measure protein n=1 Tax=Methylobacterium oryzae CBMB20 TaxID=693986 RepID=A0A089NZC1_9HYPH|nr:phage tail tape measure protein [Methylobacterium oryzae]AIQ91173.1 TP901 family phage tail tape measure protein [Methylobacterium oryzae CBMB20]